MDSNVLIYRRDASEPVRREQALAVTQSLLNSGRMALSVQSLTEFYRVSTERLPVRLPAGLAVDDVQLFASACPVLDITIDVVLKATGVASSNAISIWDALIWAVAATNGIATVLTEDIRDSIEGVRFINPFEPGFDLDAL